MLSRKSIFFFNVLTLLLAVLLCFPGITPAQFHEHRLIPLVQPIIPFGAEEEKEQALLRKEGALLANDFVVYGRAKTNKDAGITVNVDYRPILYSRESELNEQQQPNLKRMPNLETFFEFGGTLELFTTNASLQKYDIVMSEVMWGIDQGLRDTTVSVKIDAVDSSGNLTTEDVVLPQLVSQEVQWIELYNTNNRDITADLYLFFTPFESHPVRESVAINGRTYTVLDAVSTLFTGLWQLPGKSGRRPTTAFVSAYRDIDYERVEDTHLERRAQLTGIPFGSDPDSWEETPDNGRRNTELRIVTDSKLVELPYISTPGTKHVSDVFTRRLKATAVPANTLVINEVRNDTSKDNLDWVEVKNVSARAVELEDWELSVVTGVGTDIDLVDLPAYELGKGEILLLLNKTPRRTPFADGINIAERKSRPKGAQHLYFVDTGLLLPNTGKFVLLLRNQSDKNGQDAAIEDYAGNGFFLDTSPKFSTGFWPRIGQLPPTDVADFGENSFASTATVWTRRRYQKDNGHHKNAWREVGTQGGLGYDPGVDRTSAPGTPGYENDALKTKADDKNTKTPATQEYTDGEISISEIMVDAGPRQDKAQWVELYNSSMTQAVNLAGWTLEIRNATDETDTYVDGSFVFKEAILLPNQTLLLVSKIAANNVAYNRIYNVFRQHRHALDVPRRRRFLNPMGFYLKLSYIPDPRYSEDAIVIDEAGNLKVERDLRTLVWDLPERAPELRQSLVRQYGDLFRPTQNVRNGTSEPPEDGTKQDGWRHADKHYVGSTYYGDSEDRGTPGHRFGGPLPVQLSAFHPKRSETGTVLITWTTASELDNAGFNLLRSQQRNDTFVVINPMLIPGAGTSAEKHIYAFTDTTAKPDVVYYYRIEDVSFAGVHRTLTTMRLKGDMSPAGKLTTMWSHLKTENYGRF